MRELLLMRHGKAVSCAVGEDGLRPLKDRGKRAAQRMGVWLAGSGLIPDHVVAAPAVRTMATAEKCCKAAGLDARIVQCDARLAKGSDADLPGVIEDIPATAQRVLLVGHNPGIAQVLADLIGDERRRFPAGSLAHLELDDQEAPLRPGNGVLRSFVLPDDLPTGFPFPSPDGNERRARPAYYYTQSAALPYRRNGDHLEILVVRSSAKKHWVVPKGIADPGRSLQESAAKEAWEEAGVEGEMDDEPLGHYRYEKWGATCDVAVYRMRVTRVLDNVDWEESHRGRQWVSPEVAAMLIQQPQLAAMVDHLARRLAAETDSCHG
jgi:phosphohistidine phosphatase